MKTKHTYKEVLQRALEGLQKTVKLNLKIQHKILLLIYADLLGTGDERNIETAEIIYERELAKFIRED